MALKVAVIALVAVALSSGVALADDWVAVKLRGTVQQQVAGQWRPLEKGAVVPDSRMVRTLVGGRVEFVRGEEHIQLGPNTLIQIYDKGGKKPFTTVAQATGTVTIEAKVENVQHFAVETPYLAAVVKGTIFTVTSGKGSASVEVTRGHVAVEDKHDKSHVTVSAGQSAAVDDHGLTVAGSGTLPTVLTAAQVAPATVPAAVVTSPVKVTGKPADPKSTDDKGKGKGSDDTGKGEDKGKDDDKGNGKGKDGDKGKGDGGKGESGKGNSGNGNGKGNGKGK